MTKRLSTLTITTLAAAAGAGALVADAADPVRVSTNSLTRYSLGDETPVVDAQRARRGRLRASLILPSKWTRLRSTARTPLRLRSTSSCRFLVSVSGRLAEADPVAAGERAAALAPGSGQLVLDEGTRGSAAFRVVRQRGSSDVEAVLVQPLSRANGKTPNGRQTFAELRVLADADDGVECHSGGPRTIGAQMADGLAAGGAGGFGF